jgi:hypothetical protein
MTGKHWMVFLGVLGSGLLIPNFSSRACYFYIDEADHHKLFEPKPEHLQEFHGFARYYRSVTELEWNDHNEAGIKAANLDSWQEHFGKSIRRQDIEYLLYNDSQFERNIHRQTDGAKPKYLGNAISDNRLEKLWVQNKRIDELEYFACAKQCEPCCKELPAWDPSRKSLCSASKVDSLIKKGEELYSHTIVPFLRLRYAYQFIRLDHYYNRFDDAIKDYKAYAVPMLSASQEISGWIYGHYAGCLLAKREKAEAAYYYSRMYAEAPCRRDQARLSWQINTDSEWATLMSLCKNNQERADNYVLRALRWNSIPYEDMRMIQRLDPGREDLDMLLVREINKLEEELLGNIQFNATSYERLLRDKQRLPKAHKRLRTLQAIVRFNLGSGKIHDLDLWRLSDVYLSFLNGEFSEAFARLNSLLPELEGLSLARAQLMQIQFQFISNEPITRGMEESFARKCIHQSKVEKAELDHFIAFRDDALFWKYMDQGDEVKACLVKDPGRLFYRFGLRISVIDSLLVLEAHPDKNAFEIELIDRLHKQLSHERLMEIKGTCHLTHGQLDAAIAAFSSLSDSFCQATPSFTLDLDPFRPRIKRLDKKGIPWKNHTFDKRSFAITLRNLHMQTESNQGRKDLRYLLLGNAEFNTRSRGRAWEAKAFYLGDLTEYGYETRLWTGEIEEERDEEWPFYDLVNWPENTDLTQAVSYYNLAIQHSNDPELQALAYFMLAQCEKETNPCASTRPSLQKEENCIPSFKVLETQFSHTAVYDMLVNECWDFTRYTSL